MSLSSRRGLGTCVGLQLNRLLVTAEQMLRLAEGKLPEV